MNLAHKWTYLISSLGDDQWEKLELGWLKSTISPANKCIQFMFLHTKLYATTAVACQCSPADTFHIFWMYTYV